MIFCDKYDSVDGFVRFLTNVTFKSWPLYIDLWAVYRGCVPAMDGGVLGIDAYGVGVTTQPFSTDIDTATRES
jgi:hypothetical protein